MTVRAATNRGSVVKTAEVLSKDHVSTVLVLIVFQEYSQDGLKNQIGVHHETFDGGNGQAQRKSSTRKPMTEHFMVQNPDFGPLPLIQTEGSEDQDTNDERRQNSDVGPRIQAAPKT